MSQYDTTLDPTVSNTSHNQVMSLVPRGSTVLDVGCATGYLAEALVARGCVVSGIEYDAEAAEKARPHLDHLVVGDLVTMDLAREFGDRRYDVIVCADILEHLPDPVDALRRLVTLLRPGGSVVISIPNVAHGSLRLALLQGRWRYTETGLLDRTHIRFVTRTTLLELLAEAGVVAVEVRTTWRDVLDSDVSVDTTDLPAGVVDWVRQQPDSGTYQFIVRAVPDDGEGALRRAVDERDALRAELERARREAERSASEREAAEESLRRIQATRSWRLLRAPRALYGRVARRGGSR